MRADDVVCASDDAFSAVCSEDDDGCDGGFEGAMEVSEAFDVQHVNLVDKQDTGNELSDSYQRNRSKFHL